MNYLSCVEVQPQTKADAAVIWLHGLGADGHDFEGVVPQLKLPENSAIRFVFPHAPSIPVTINGGYIMPAWYDIMDQSIERKVDLSHLNDSAVKIQALIDREIERGISSDRIVIAGFSQGGAVALQAALTYPKPLAGLLVMSSYFASKESIQINPANSAIKLAIMHGSLDPIVNPILGKRALQSLAEMGFHPDYKSYTMGHNVCAEQINDISAWLLGCLADK
ncbi:alpha/beta hydrolase [Psychromonas sp.]|uniref:alpha/beta hydrolase n=1 Tax=Psychromonas sp. TaxID=1884585 RepID=UPI003569CD2C